jgi:uncharacterized protein (TIGR03083 family)
MVDGHSLHQALKTQSAAFRAAVVQAGPDAAVSTCPEWDIRGLVRHLARAYHMMCSSMELAPGDSRPPLPPVPEDFDAALSWWDEKLADVVDKLSTMDPDRPAWWFGSGGTVRDWARRAAHETAIHRLDAEYALAEHGHDLLFDPAFAADGIDEVLSALVFRIQDWQKPHPTGRVLNHAADAGQTWLVSHRPGQQPDVGAPRDAALGSPETDATVAGTADAVYRRVWGRPSTAMVTGDQALADLIAGV